MCHAQVGYQQDGECDEELFHFRSFLVGLHHRSILHGSRLHRLLADMSFDMKHHTVVDGIGGHGNRLVDGTETVGVVFHSDNGGLAGGDGISRPRRNSTTARSLALGDGQRSLASVLELELALAVKRFESAVASGKKRMKTFRPVTSLL